jgi:phenylalanyl-tRNA synthetase beta chain
MKFSEAWLREWVSPDLESAALAEQLTMAGLEVDSIEPVAADFEGVRVAEVMSVEPHPDADKLRVCSVSIDESEPLQIVCGAPNVRAGMKAPLATVGGRIGDMKIKKAKLRGVPSHGMLCSARELGLSDEHEGLLSLAADAPVGEDLRAYLGLDDISIDVDLTPNRGDCLGIEGIAREVGTLTGTDLTPPPLKTVDAEVSDVCGVSVESPEACPRYLGRVIKGIDPSVETPLWMQERLRRSGLRSLGPVVDVTNYVLLELGQPMHAFDRDRLGDGIVVRYAAKGEKLTLLDDREIEPGADTLLICDHEKPLALAGIMGGIDSGISAETRTLFLEVAYFEPEIIAGKARAYGLTTDASHRFERGVDPELQWRAMERATGLLLELVGGEAGPVVETVAEQFLPVKRPVLLRRSRIQRLLGFLPGDEEVSDMLERLGNRLQPHADGWQVTPPSYRFDLSIEADLIEEVGRIFGYDNLPTANNRGDLVMRSVPETSTPLSRLRSLLIDRGYQEAITYSFVDADQSQLFEPTLTGVKLANPISSEMSVMRTSLWCGLVNALKYNIARQQSRVQLFESGLKYVHQDNEIKQVNVLSGVVSGELVPEQWGQASRSVDFFDIKSDIEALFELAACSPVSFEPGIHTAMHPGQTARLSDDGVPVGWLGCVHPEIAKRLQISSQTYLFELKLESLHKGHLPSFEKLSRFPSIRRDLAVVVDADVPTVALRDCIEESAGSMLRNLLVFDVYQGQGIETGRKSIALGLILQDSSRTLTDDDVDGLINGVTRQLEEKFGATLRE